MKPEQHPNLSFQQILEQYRTEAFSQSDKGRRFERLMRNFLLTYQVYDQKFRNVWLWSDFPYRASISGKDIGIDLVAETTDGEYWAVQCKCFASDAYITKRHVDTFLGPSGKSFQLEDGRETGFSTRLWICTTDRWSSEAESELKNQKIPCVQLSLFHLEDARVDWALLDAGHSGPEARLPGKQLLPHQLDALNNCVEHFSVHDRAKLVMACGTGKTFTSLRIAERLTGGRGLVLFLAPSIALIGQTLREWSADALRPFYPLCVCSDPGVSSKAKDNSDRDLTGTESLALPASTSAAVLAERLADAEKTRPDRLNVILSTYQSIERVSEALKKLRKTVDLVICDEAHRTTGVKLADEDESHFVKIHDDGFIKAAKRLYMTATPRIYADNVKNRAKAVSAALCSMDDESLFGREAYHIGFGEAVDRGLLSDYKVLVLTIDQNELSLTALAKLQYSQKVGDRKEIETDDCTKLAGCLQVMSKNMIYEGKHLLDVDPGPMRTAVAFCQTIKKSMAIANVFKDLGEAYGNDLEAGERRLLLDVDSDHVDGGMGALARELKMRWLKGAPEFLSDGGSDAEVFTSTSNECRILTNVKCLSEGVDVPSLDAVMFLSAKNSEIEVVQSVGRVMRRAPGKKFGYIIIPVVVPGYVKPEEVLDDHERFKVVWTVLNALKSHDDRFDSLIKRIELNLVKPDGGGSVLIGGIARKNADSNEMAPGPGDAPAIKSADLLAALRDGDGLHKALYARLVTKVGTRQDMEQWAGDVAKIAEDFKERITETIHREGPPKEEFDKFLGGLRETINPSVDEAEAVEMLSQHLITKPVFEALFENHAFVRNNPVSQAMEGVLGVLEPKGFDRDRATLDRFYQSVQNYVSGFDNALARQKTIVSLYDNFFKIAAPKAVEKLGIVYTPIEVVDFINNSVAEVLRREFGRDLSDEGVHVLDPFTGTASFIARLIQSGLIRQDSLERKYLSELHANEIVLLAYYIASVNIEAAYHEMMGEDTPYQPFEGICLTDTFQLHEGGDKDLLAAQRMERNTERLAAQKRSPIMAIVGNPPYSIGQRAANDNAQNQSYPVLEGRIAETYAARSTGGTKKGLYDSYVKALRWSSDRLYGDSGGVVAFVTNAGWLDGNAMDGMRKCLTEEFSKIFVFNLRGNQRTSGELSRREGGKIFGSGSRTAVAISILIKKPGHQGPAEILYHDVGDYLSRDEKLAILAERRHVYNPDLGWERITPDDNGDWLNQRTGVFDNYTVIGDKTDKQINSFFHPTYSLGLYTSRDSWCYNFSKINLINNITSSIHFYNETVNRIDIIKNSKSKIILEEIIDFDPTKFHWDHLRKNDALNAKKYEFSKNSIREMMYRPLSKQYGYFNRQLNSRVYLLPQLFPTAKHNNLVICVSGIGVTKEFSTLITDITPDLELIGKSQCFPRYYYEKVEQTGNSLFATGDIVDGYKRRDAVTDFILKEAVAKYGTKVTKDDLYYYIYGFLHSEDYRTTFSADLKKSLPRIPLVDDPADFLAFSKAGRDLADLHLNYETAEPYGQVSITGLDKGNFKVTKMRFASKDDKSIIDYNHAVRITGVPLEAYDYVVNGRSAIEWIIDRYQVRVDKDSGIKNDPNDWAKEHGQPRYILDLLLRVITVSLETMKIVKGLPRLTF